ncbi:MAG: efflux RND transporter permease subunit [Lachnospiraceae bacterium]|nr:efflux RND transporter permease subunit [Lachnospiraceae bacterium]MEE3461511.1 efflux RND transporter permease subunit [Lachnospiraceae bacterium]
MPKFSVKRPYLVLVVVLALAVLAIAGVTRMTTDFLPHMEFPYVAVITTYPGAAPQKVETEVTDPLESSLSTITGVKNITSTSGENSSQIMMEFEENTNMDGAMVKISSAINMVDLPDGVGDPMLMEISADMMPVMYVSVGAKGLSGSELSEYLNDNVIPRIKRQDGVATVQTSGLIEDSVEIKLDQDKIDDINDKILKATNKSLKKAGDKLDEAEKKLDEAESKINSQKSGISDKTSSTADQLSAATKGLNQAMSTKAAYDAQLASLKAYETALKTERSAYDKNKVKESLDAIEAGFTAVRSALSGQIAAVTGTDPVSEGMKKKLKEQLDSLPTDAKDAIDHPEKLEAYNNFLAAQAGANTGQSGETGSDPATKGQTGVSGSASGTDSLVTGTTALTSESIKKLYDIVHTRIPQIESELESLKSQIATAKAVADAVDKNTKKALDSYESAESGKFTAAVQFGAGTAGLNSGSESIKSGRDDLKKARESYENSKEEALKNSNIDALLDRDTLSGLIKAQNFSMPAGYINDDKTQYLLKIDDEISSVDDIKDLLLTKIKKVGDIRISDIADVNMVNNADDMYAKVNGEDAVVLAVYKSGTASTSDVSGEINREMKRIQSDDDKFTYTTIMDQGQYIGVIINSVFSNLLWGALLSIIVLLLFLRDIRPTLVVALSIPLSVLFALLAMYLSDMTLNIISLSGLALGIGMLVDNSIVVTENIYRIRNKGIGAVRASVMGANQVAAAIFSSTLTTICVFMPIIFTDGITRQMIQDLSLTITFSLLASLVVALTVVPTMGATFLKNDKAKEHKLFDKALNGYEKAARFCLRFKIVPLAAAVALLVLSIFGISKMGIVMFPDMDSYQLSADITADPYTDRDEDYAMVDRVSGEIRKIKGVETVGGVASSTLSNMSSNNKNYTIMIILDKKYSYQNKVIAKKIEKIIEKENVDDYSVASSNMDTSQMFGSGLSVDITGKDPDKINEISSEIIKLMEKTGKLTDISNGQETSEKQLVLKIDRDKAMRKGLTVAQIYQQIQNKLTSDSTAANIMINNDVIDVVLNDERDKITRSNILDYELSVDKTDKDGKTEKKYYRLGDFADMNETDSVATIGHTNGNTIMTVTGQVKEGQNVELISRDFKKELAKVSVPDGYTIEISGEEDSIRDMLKNILLMIVVSLILIYLIMVAQFQNFLSPFIVMFTIPLAFTGGFIALLVTGQQLSMLSMIGFLILSGVVVNNGIVFIDYVNQLRREGTEKREALIEAGRTRMRPILMTALTTIFSMSVMAVSHGEAAEMGRGMAIVTIGGLTYATLMTLFIVPVLYDIMYRKKTMKKIDLGDEDTLNAEEGEEI